MRTLLRLALICCLLAVATSAGCGGSGGETAPAANLSALACSTGKLNPAFAPDTYAYAVGPGVCAGTGRLTPTAEDEGTTITVNGVATRSGTASNPVPLAIGITDVTIVCTAAEEASRRTYTVTFQRTGPTRHEAYLKASNTEGLDHLGLDRRCIAISGDTIVVGAPEEDSSTTGVNGAEGDNGAQQSGAAHVFVRQGSTWTQQAYLKASNAGYQDEFGSSVAISGDRIVVGAPRERSSATGVGGDQSDNGAGGSGAAYVVR